MLAEYSCICRFHIINGTTSDNLTYLLNMVMDFNVTVGIVAVIAVDGVIEHIASEPFSVIEGDIEIEFFLTALLSYSNMA